MNHNEFKAYELGFQSAQIDFEAGLNGLLAGHKTVIEQLKQELADKDRAFLLAVALTKKGSRFDADGHMTGIILDAIGKPRCIAEQDFVDNAKGDIVK